MGMGFSLQRVDWFHNSMDEQNLSLFLTFVQGKMCFCAQGQGGEQGAKGDHTEDYGKTQPVEPLGLPVRD